MSASQDRVDLEARLRAARILHEKFRRVLEDILEGKPPRLVIPKRTLSNTIFDPKRGILLLGSETLEREFLDMGEARRFMQTLLMASIIYQALVENEYPTIRDLYYRGKHTIVYRDLSGRLREENTWDEQAESDAVIRDVEVFTGLLREDMLILSKEKGKVVGNMRIRSGGDVIDLSKLGHGAYAIESTPDLIEFLDWDAEFVLVVEKDAVFQQLHRIGFWKKYKAILVTGAGQPDRATRRFVRRLNEELGLPVYILTDSIPADEVVVARDPEGWVRAAPIEEMFSDAFKGLEREWVPLKGWSVPAWNPATGDIVWTDAGYIYRHYIDGTIVEIETRGRGTIRVTGGHSLYVIRDGEVKLVTASEVVPGDYIVVAESIPSPQPQLQRGMPSCSDASARSSLISRGLMRVSEENAWLLGMATLTSRIHGSDLIVARLRGSRRRAAGRILEILRSCGVRAYLDEEPGYTDVIVEGEECLSVARALGLKDSSSGDRVPPAILSAPTPVKLAYIKGLIEGSGKVCSDGTISIRIPSPSLAKEVFNLLLLTGINPALSRVDGDYVLKIAKHPARTPPALYKALTGIEDAPEYSAGPDTVYAIPVGRKLLKKLMSMHGRGSFYLNSSAHRVSKWKLRRIIDSLPSRGGLRALVAGDAVAVEVVSVKHRSYEGYVYDIAVPVLNTFIGSYGVIYHNSDPYGWYIYSVFKVGSIQLSYESERLATPKARFLGVSMTDVFGYKNKKPYLTEAERRNFIIKAKEADIKRAKELLNYSWFQTPGWRREIRIFLEKKAKLEIEALASKGLKFLAFKYIPEKIETGDWIE